MSNSETELREDVRRKYAEIATSVARGAAGRKRLGEQMESWKRLVAAMSAVLKARPEEA